MLSPKNSRTLALKRQIALFKKDFEMVKKIEQIKSDKEITQEIKNYNLQIKGQNDIVN